MDRRWPAFGTLVEDAHVLGLERAGEQLAEHCLTFREGQSQLGVRQLQKLTPSAQATEADGRQVTGTNHQFAVGWQIVQHLLDEVQH
ncbi:hypothetical protein D3C78_1377950 [compost metagenome]